MMALFCAAVERNRDERMHRKAERDADDRKEHYPAIEDKTGDSDTIGTAVPNRPQAEPNPAE
jgi:hypothetical protein